MTNGVITPREGSIKILKKVFFDGAYSNIELKNFLRDYPLEKRDRAFLTELTYGVMQKKSLIDFYISKFSKTLIKNIDSEILLILEVSIYQILYMDKVPPSAACNEGVEMAKKYYSGRFSSFVNGVLREIIRCKDALPPIDEPTKEDYFARAFSLPVWLTKMWIEQYGVKECRALCESTNERRATVIRANTLKTNKEDIKAKLTENSIQYEEILGLENSFRINFTGDMGELDLYKKGEITVQDIGSQLAVGVLSPRKGQRVMDICSAPGGKCVLMGEYMENSGEIMATDIHEHKMDLIRKNAKRMCISIITPKIFNMEILWEEQMDSFDKILCDVPCSGLGIIAKKPDIRYKLEDEIKNLPEIQEKILNNALKYLKVGGELVYSTCTINKSENEDIVKKVLENNKNFELQPFSLEYMGIKSDGMLQLLPHVHNSDGFFIAKLRRSK